MIIFSLSAETSCRSCSLPWHLAYHHDENGNTIAGWRYGLISAVLSSARVRVVILGNSYSTETDNIHVHAGHVFAQLLQHVSKASWDRFQDNAYWWWVYVSTNGQMHMTRYSVGSSTHRGTNGLRTSIKWYVQRLAVFPTPLYSNQANGNKEQGDLDDLVTSVQNGQEIRCVSTKGYSFPLQNVAVNTNGAKYVSGQSLDHISTRTSGNLIQFQSNAYWWFTVVTTRGLRDMSRWGRMLGPTRHEVTPKILWPLNGFQMAAGGKFSPMMTVEITYLEAARHLRQPYCQDTVYVSRSLPGITTLPRLTISLCAEVMLQLRRSNMSARKD